MRARMRNATERVKGNSEAVLQQEENEIVALLKSS
jgi:hypothetical protein